MEKKIIGTSKSIESLKTKLTKTKTDKNREKLLNKVILVTGMPKSHYKDWSSVDLEDRLYGIEVGDGRFLTKTIKQSQLDDIETRRYMIKEIIAITKEKTISVQKL